MACHLMRGKSPTYRPELLKDSLRSMTANRVGDPREKNSRPPASHRLAAHRSGKAMAQVLSYL
jgi:hypothetical protein